MVQSGIQHHLITTTVVLAGRSHLYLCHFSCNNNLVTTHLKLYGNSFVLEGRLIENKGHLTELLNNVIKLATNAYTAPTLPAIAMALAANLALQQVMPYAANNSGTKALKSGCIVPIFHCITGVWLPYMDRMTLPQFWTSIYPVIKVNSLADSCQALLNFFHLEIICIINNRPPPVEKTHPISPTYHTALLCHCSVIKASQFLIMRCDAQMFQASASLCTSKNST